MRKYFVLLAVPVPLAASCRSTEADDAMAEPATSETPLETSEDASVDGSTDTTVIEDDRAPGVTEESIKVGITYVDFDAMGDQVSIDHGDDEAAYMAVINDINADGGIHGRTVEAVFGPVNPANAVSTDETCTRLTQDEEVFVAVGNLFGEVELCFVDVNETAVIGGDVTEERIAAANAPWFTLDPGADSQVTALRRLIDQGQIDGSAAVVLDGTDGALFERLLLSMLVEAGIDPVDVYVLDSGAEPEQQQAATNAALARFESSGVETVLALGAAGAPVVAGGLERSDYRPKIVITNSQGALSFVRDDSRDQSVLTGAIAAGAYDQDAMLELDGPTRECFDLQREAGLVLTPPSQVEQGQPNQFVSSHLACQQISLLAALLEAAGPDLDYGSFQSAGYNLGEVELPTNPKPFFYGPPPHADGDLPQYLYEFDTANEEFRLVGDGAC